MRFKNRNTFLFLFTPIDMFYRFWSDQSLIYTKLREHFTAKRGEGGFVLLRIVIYFVLFLSVCLSPLAKFQKILCLAAIHWGDVEAWNLCSSPSQRCGNPILLTWFALFATVSFNTMKFMHKKWFGYGAPIYDMPLAADIRTKKVEVATLNSFDILKQTNKISKRK